MADLILQPETLPGFVREHIDEARGAGSLDAVSFYTLYFYGDRQWCHQRVDAYRREWTAGRAIRRHWRAELDDELMAHAHQLWPSVPENVRRGILRSSVLDLSLHIAETAEWMAHCAMTDACEGGCMQAFNVPPRPGSYGAWYPGKRVRRRVLSPRFIRNYVRRDNDLARRRMTAQYALARWREGPIGTRDDESAIADLFEAQQPSTLPEPTYRRELTQWMEAQCGVKIKKIKPRDQRRERRKITRAALFANSLLAPGQVGAFARGTPVVIAGRELTFAVAKADRLGAVGHGCLDIGVSATGGPLLGTLCFYIKETPCLDQLAAIALHAGAGTEREILAIANMVTVVEESLTHPFMVERRAGQLAELIARPAFAPVLPLVPEPIRLTNRIRRQWVDARQLAQQRNDGYWHATRKQWFGALSTALLGLEGQRYLKTNNAVA